MKTLALTLLLLIAPLVAAQEPTDPPSTTRSTTYVEVVSEADPAKLEAAAIRALVNDGMTTAAARESVRRDGVTDVGRCKEILIIRAIGNIAALVEVEVRVSNPPVHPSLERPQ